MKKFKILYTILGIGVVIATVFALSGKFSSEAQTTDTETVTTKIVVGNSPPAFTVAPAESPASYATSPTTPGAAITFTARGTDPNNENYYLVICSTNSVTAGAAGAAPTCAATRYCVSSSTASATNASCSYTTSAANPWTNDWYAFVCDNNATLASCSAASQGSGNSGSPFNVNHAPVFTNITNNSPRDPGVSVTWTATANDTTDSGTVKLVVCKTAAISGTTCSGGQWCSSSLVASNPSCSYSIPAVTADGSNNAYAYIFDSLNTPSADAKQASNIPFTVNNVTPTVASVTLNGGAAIDLAEKTTKSVTITATISDNNGCTGGEISTVRAYVYRSGIGYSGCDAAGKANGNNCYPEITCSAGTCSGANVPYTCSVPIQYYADPTDKSYPAELGSMNYKAETWIATVKATDNNSANSNAASTGVNINSLAAFEITGELDYGSLDAGGTNATLTKTLVVTPTGNSPFHVMHKGTQMCTDSPTCATTGGKTPIPIAQQKYALASGTSYASGTALSATDTKVLLNVPKVDNGTVTTKTTWWGMAIPLGTVPGTYNGTNTITSTAEGT